MAADTDGSGDINYTEFIAATIGSSIYSNEAYLKQAFDMFDKDKSGKIDKDEVVGLLSGEEMSGLVPVSAIEAAIKEIDQDGDGEIDFEEFIEMMKKAHEINLC